MGVTSTVFLVEHHRARLAGQTKLFLDCLYGIVEHLDGDIFGLRRA